MSESRSRRVFFGLFTALLVVMVIEGSARVFMAGLEPTGFDDASWRNSWERNHAERGEICYAFDRFDPTKGWIAQPDFRDDTTFPGKLVTTNSLGLRSRHELDAPPPDESLSIVVLGDSFTFGDEVGDDEVYVSGLEQRLPGARVVNFGVHGYGHDQMLILLRELGASARPDLVLLGFVYADIYRNLLSFRDFAKPRFELEDGELVLRGLPLPSPEQVQSASPFRSRVPDVLEVARGLYQARSGELDSEARELTRHILDELLREIRALGATPAFVYLPVEAEIENTSPEPSSHERYLLEYCRSREIACTSLRPRFAAEHAAGADLRTLGHWGPDGHRIAAEGIAAFVSGLGLASELREPEPSATTSSMIP